MRKFILYVLYLLLNPRGFRDVVVELVVTAAARNPPPVEAARVAFGNATLGGLITTDDDPEPNGSVLLTITPGSSLVQRSGKADLNLFNLGDRRIAAVFFDVRSAVFRDNIFDADGRGGDRPFQRLTYRDGTEVDYVPIDDYQVVWLPARDDDDFDPTAPFDVGRLDDVNNLFVDETANHGRISPRAGSGYRGQLLLFRNFTSGSKTQFGSDMDPNCLAGFKKPSVDEGSNPVNAGKVFHVGGVSGAEMTGSLISVLFGDGAIASSTIAHDGSQSGGIAWIRTFSSSSSSSSSSHEEKDNDDEVIPPPELKVSGLSPGQDGYYNREDNRPFVTLHATSDDDNHRLRHHEGHTIRVSMVKGFNPTGGQNVTVANGDITIHDLVQARLDAQYPDFPVTDAVEWQHIDVDIPEGKKDEDEEDGSSPFLDLSSNFRYDGITIPDDASSPFEGDDELPIAFVAVVVDKETNRPLSYTTAPIRLLYNEDGSVPPPPPPPPPPTQPSAASPTTSPLAIPPTAPSDAVTASPTMPNLAMTQAPTSVIDVVIIAPSTTPISPSADLSPDDDIMSNPTSSQTTMGSSSPTMATSVNTNGPMESTSLLDTVPPSLDVLPSSPSSPSLEIPTTSSPVEVSIIPTSAATAQVMTITTSKIFGCGFAILGNVFILLLLC